MKKLMLLIALLAMLTVAAIPAMAQLEQDSEQEADESGDVDQSFEVSGSGSNGNQCAGIQGVANTGNAQSQIDVIQYGSEADEFDFDEVDTSIEVSPDASTTCTQEVNQAASASG